MIPVYYIEDLTVEEVDSLVERGVVFDIASRNTDKTTLLSRDVNTKDRDAFWYGGDKQT